MQTPARLTILLAQNSPQALIIRRGPSRHTAIIGWNRKDDTFVVGQWIKGKILDSDISPDGRYWIYTAMGTKNWHTWTATAYVPYLKALNFFRTGDYCCACGRFISNREYCFGCNPGSAIIEQYKNTNHTISAAPDGWQDIIITRNGWKRLVIDGQNIGLIKRINDYWDLQILYSRNQRPLSYHQNQYQMKNTHTGAAVVMDAWEWADVDGGRLVWAEKGLVISGIVTKHGIKQHKILYDSNPLTFTEMEAPY